jgi:purine-binding chemotaxis protein CheW
MAPTPAARALVSSELPVPGPSRVLVVELDRQLLAFDLGVVQELRGVATLSRVAGSPAALLGLLELRGDMLPVYDLGELLGEGLCREGAVLVVLQHNAQRFALRVDALRDVMELDPSAWRAAPVLRATSPVRALCGSPDGLLTLLDPERLLQLGRH